MDRDAQAEGAGMNDTLAHLIERAALSGGEARQQAVARIAREIVHDDACEPGTPAWNEMRDALAARGLHREVIAALRAGALLYASMAGSASNATRHDDERPD